MSRGKHSYDEGFSFNFSLKNIENLGSIIKKIGIIIVVLAIIGFGVIFGRNIYSNLKSNGYFSKNDKNPSVVPVSSLEEKMPTNLYGYNVLGKLTIDSKNYSKYILDASSKKDNNTNVTEKANENTANTTTQSETNNVTDTEINNSLENTNSTEDISNSKTTNLSEALKKGIVKLYGDKLNTIGNFCIIGHNEKNLFEVLNELKVNDKFEIENTSKSKMKYVVTKIYTVEPTDLKCLIPNEKYKEVTLITCTAGSNLRLVVKALEENDYKLFLKESELENQTSVDSNNENKVENDTIQ